MKAKKKTKPHNLVAKFGDALKKAGYIMHTNPNATAQARFIGPTEKEQPQSAEEKDAEFFRKANHFYSNLDKSISEQEWTPEALAELLDLKFVPVADYINRLAKLAAAHNAAIFELWNRAAIEIEHLRQQLAAERERLERVEEDHMKYTSWAAREIQAQIKRNKTLVEALEKISTGRWPPESAQIAKDALAKEGK
jgi:hypothetical protein